MVLAPMRPCFRARVNHHIAASASTSNAARIVTSLIGNSVQLGIDVMMNHHIRSAKPPLRLSAAEISGSTVVGLPHVLTDVVLLGDEAHQ